MKLLDPTLYRFSRAVIPEEDDTLTDPSLSLMASYWLIAEERSQRPKKGLIRGENHSAD